MMSSGGNTSSKPAFTRTRYKIVVGLMVSDTAFGRQSAIASRSLLVQARDKQEYASAL